MGCEVKQEELREAIDILELWEDGMLEPNNQAVIAAENLKTVSDAFKRLAGAVSEAEEFVRFFKGKCNPRAIEWMARWGS